MKRTRFQGERGAATVEFAIIAIVFLLVVFGIIEFGILMFDQHVLTNASREGARAGIVMRVPRLPYEFNPLERKECIDNCEAKPHPNEVDYCIKICEGINKIVLRYAKEHMVTFGTPNDPVTDVVWRVWVKDEDAKPNPKITKVEYNTSTLPSDIVFNFGDELVVTVTYEFDFLLLSIVGINTKTLKAETRMRME